jgi:cyclophilin family peptidyl-prolyl cis-trans isomerase/HEAT repeat protein
MVRVSVVALGLVLVVADVSAQPPLRERMLAAEDRRGTSEADLAPITEALESRDAGIRRLAVRALGRFERPALIPLVLPALDDGVGIRAEAAWALAQLARTPESVAQVQDVLIARATRDADAGLWEVWGELAAALGRLPYSTAAQVARTETLLVAQLPSPDSLIDPETPAVAGAIRGIEALVRISRKVGAPQPATWDRIRWSATAQRPAADPRSAWIRRLAMAALVTGGEATPSVIERALNDRDSEVRRLGALAAGGEQTMAERDRLLRMAITDANPQVRLEALRSWGRRLQSTSCAPVRALVKDPDPHVMLQAIDLLGAPCPAGEGPRSEIGALVETLGTGPRAWHAPAHALVALARVSPAEARPALPRFVGHATWQVRMYAARAAAALPDVETLTRLARDPHHNVREAALQGLLDLKRPEAVPAALDALASDDYQLVLTATRAFAATPDSAKAVPALIQALARLTKHRKDTSRDPRMAILQRLQVLGGAAQASAIEPYLRDFDPRIAEQAAQVLEAWTGTRPTPAPQPLAAPVPTLEALEALRGARLRVTMAGRGSFDISLDPDQAPLTVLRIAARARAGYYNGLTFHRVAPNFVIQGGSPGANEYAGDALYMRDEVGLHRRGTVGISTRGRDTGDAQLFVNLVDSPRLDHQYTVFGTVTSGMEIVDGIIEGDVIERAEVVGK